MDGDDVLKRYQNVVIKWVCLASFVLVFPFTLNNFLHHRWLVGSASFAVVVCLLWNCLRLKRDKKPHLEFLFPAIGVFLVLSFQEQGVIGAFWSYPAISLFYFVLPHDRARWVNLALLIAIVPSAFHVLPGPIASRVTASLLGISVTSGIFVFLIETQARELRKMAVVDPLTQVYNRLQMDMVLAQARARALRHQTPSTLLALDIDHFKSVNDEFGHDVGDRVLCQVAAVLKSRTRETDSIFRTGGEEFLVVLDGADLVRGAMIAEELRALVAASRLLEKRPVTVSVGVSQWRESDEVRDWLKRADQRLYRAKVGGRNKVVSEDLPDFQAGPSSPMIRMESR